ncbi:HPF/RaiA family ribosome-associated protein [Methylocystis echinoides]|uniref:HPF/RaiA family ribosome-associated protein n=1 Tax=Methylocystis echinoides TaxID=29468 RepID=UPI0034354117
MKTQPQIDFQGMDPSESFRQQIVSHIERLEDRYGRMTSCRVVVKAPGGHHRTGGLYEINIYLSLPDEREVAVERTPHQDERFQRFEFALGDAFARAVRQLQDQVARMRGKVKQHDEPLTGVVRRLMREEGYGFLESADGREIYFHRNSVQEPGFDHLEPGVRVGFKEEEGDEGPQASRVSPLGEHSPE